MKNLISYKSLLQDLGEQKPTYAQLLSTVEWSNFRDRILNRDNHRCVNCGNQPTEKRKGQYMRNMLPIEIEKDYTLELYKYELKEPDFEIDGSEIKLKPAKKTGHFTGVPIIMEVHHHYYILGELPWSYPLNALSTLCNNCHLDHHINNPLIVYADESLKNPINVRTCSKCSGIGFLPEYKYIQSGQCFKCDGKGYLY